MQAYLSAWPPGPCRGSTDAHRHRQMAHNSFCEGSAARGVHYTSLAAGGHQAQDGSESGKGNIHATASRTGAEELDLESSVQIHANHVLLPVPLRYPGISRTNHLFVKSIRLIYLLLVLRNSGLIMTEGHRGSEMWIIDDGQVANNTRAALNKSLCSYIDILVGTGCG